MVLENRVDRRHARLLEAAGLWVGHGHLARSVRQHWRRVLVEVFLQVRNAHSAVFVDLVCTLFSLCLAVRLREVLQPLLHALWS